MKMPQNITNNGCMYLKMVGGILYLVFILVGFFWNVVTLIVLSASCLIVDKKTEEINGTQLEENEKDCEIEWSGIRKCFDSSLYIYNLALFVIYVLSFACTCCSVRCKRKNSGGAERSRNVEVGVNIDAVAKLIESGYIHLVHPVSNSLDYFMVKRLIQNTWVYDRSQHERKGVDARNLRHSGMKIRAIFKVKNPQQWNPYKEKRMELEKEFCDELIKKKILTEEDDVMHYKAEKDNELQDRSSSRDVEKNESEGIPLIVPLDDRLETYYNTQLEKNETYLFHGTKVENLKSIIENGFDYERFARTGLYGRGIYLAESSEKADQYADFVNRRRRTDLTVIIVRTLLGSVRAHHEESAIDLEDECSSDSDGGSNVRTCNSFVTALNKRFREFVLHDRHQTFPEFIVLYDRDDGTTSGEP